MNTQNISTLKIHKLTQTQYDRELAAGNIDENALYLTPDEEVASIENGGTGATTAAAARENLGAAEVGHTHNSVKDGNDNKDITFAYSGSSITKANWFGAWEERSNDYRLRAISANNLLSSIGASPAGHTHTASDVGALPATSNIYVDSSDNLIVGDSVIQPNGYIKGTWFQVLEDNSMSYAPEDETICIQSNGWIYSRTPAQILGDIGALSKAGGTITGDLNVNGKTKFTNVIMVDNDCYGTALPTAGTAGRIFFKKVSV